MNERIDISVYVKDIAWTEGIQWRVNHASCPAGEDTRSRLYLKCVSPEGSFVGYCHNCGNYGASFAVNPKKSLIDLLQEDERGVGKVKENRNMDQAIAAHRAESVLIRDLHIKVWLYKHYIWEDDWTALHFTQNKSNGYLYIPVGDNSLQVRTFSAGPSRYYTMYHTGEEKHFYTSPRRSFPTPAGKSHVILTEDAVSSHRVERELGLPSFASLGTNLSASLVNIFRERLQMVHIWYDGDSAGRQASQKVWNELSVQRGGRTHIVVCDKSPKEYDPETLREVWDSHIKSIK